MTERRAASGVAVALLAVTALVFSVVPVSAQETVFGGHAAFAAGASGDASLAGSVSPFLRLGLSPDLAIFADTAELRASGTIERTFPGSGALGLEASLDALHLRLYPTDWLTLDVGLQDHLPGAALLLSPVNYLAPLALDSLSGFGASGELPSTDGPAALIGATAFVGSGYVSAHLSPAPAGFQLPEIDAAILDGVSLLSAIDDTDMGGPLTRASFSLGDAQRLTDPWRRVSFDIEVGGNLGPIDLTAIFYHGVDRVPTAAGTIATTGVPPGQFSLAVVPAEAVIDALGLSAQTALGPAMLWLDGSYTLARSFATLDAVATASPGQYQLDTLIAPHFEIVAGGLVRLFRPSLMIAAEYRHGFLGTDRSDVIRLDFPGTVLLSLAADFADGLVSTTAAAIVLIPDRSAVIVGSVEVTLSDELSVYIRAPVVVAGSDSLLGGLQSQLSITTGLTYRF